MQDFFEDYNGETQVQHQNNTLSSHNEDNEFEYGNITMQPTMENTSLPQYNQTYANLDVANDITLRIRQQENKINEKLRVKANEQYEEKQKRKEQGRNQLEEFKEKKQREKRQRKQDNVRNEELNKLNAKKQGEQSSWKKVALNVPLKQGEYKGQKDINRMREAIIHKRDDQN